MTIKVRKNPPKKGSDIHTSSGSTNEKLGPKYKFYLSRESE